MEYPSIKIFLPLKMDLTITKIRRKKTSKISLVKKNKDKPSLMDSLKEFNKWKNSLKNNKEV